MPAIRRRTGATLISAHRSGRRRLVSTPFRCAAIVVMAVWSGLALAACGAPSAAPTQAVARASTRTTAPAGVHQPTAAAQAPRTTVQPVSSPPPAGSVSKTAQLVAAPAQLPAFKAESWVAQAPGPVLAVTGHDIGLNECASVDGATTWQQQGYKSSGGSSAILETYTFKSAAVATAADTGVLSGMQRCQSTSRALQTANHITADAVCAETAHTARAEAFERTWTGVQGISAAGPQINHLYIALRGSTILILHFDELNTRGSSAGTYSVRNDPAVLTMLTGLLATRA